tara:strand:+ start:1352 stop:1537 length:186 start_codon:yes stop_codon:yes gene_type:complete
MKTKDLKKLSGSELSNKINGLKKDLFNYRFRKVNGQIEDTAKITSTKRDLAKILTLLNKKK